MEGRGGDCPDPSLAAEIGKVAEDLTAWFTASLEVQRAARNNECPERDDCLAAGVDLEEWDDEGHQVERCRGCNRFRTVLMPAELEADAAMAVRLRTLKEGGAVFSYPEGLGVREWLVMEALTRAIRTEEDEAAKEREREAEMERRKAEMNRGRA